MKFLVDIPLSPALAEWLTRQGHDAVHGSTVGLQRASDEEIIVIARAEKRIIVTADLDYPRLLSLEQAISPGLIPFQRWPVQRRRNGLPVKASPIPVDGY